MFKSFGYGLLAMLCIGVVHAGPPSGSKLDCDVEHSKICVVRIDVQPKSVTVGGRTYSCVATGTVERVGVRDSNAEDHEKMLVLFMLMQAPGTSDPDHVYRFARKAGSSDEGIEIRDNAGARKDFNKVDFSAIHRQIYGFRINPGKAKVPEHQYEVFVERKTKGSSWPSPARQDLCWGGDPIIANDN